MKIAFCTPFKPLNHPRVSGDVTIAKGLVRFFQEKGHEVQLVPHVSTKRIWSTPQRWLQAHIAALEIQEYLISENRPDLWFTYHSYYKAPDIFGTLAVKNNIPYTMFAPSHAPKRKQHWKTCTGYYLNKRALQKTSHIFSNKQRDLEGLEQVVDSANITFIPPGIRTEDFTRDETTREENRTTWNAQNSVVVLTVAMLREGTKSEGVEHVIKSCGTLLRNGYDITLVVAGDGTMRSHLETQAQQLLPERHHFLGTVSSQKLPQLYSSCDIFAFPGINEGLGMVYLEAQSCGLPVVAWDHDGAPQVVTDGVTGIITPSYDSKKFTDAIGKLTASKQLRTTMGTAAATHAATNHNMHINYEAMDQKLRDMIQH